MGAIPFRYNSTFTIIKRLTVWCIYDGETFMVPQSAAIGTTLKFSINRKEDRYVNYPNKYCIKIG